MANTIVPQRLLGALAESDTRYNAPDVTSYTSENRWTIEPKYSSYEDKDTMMLSHKKTQNTTRRRVIWLMLASLLLTACGGPVPAKTYTIGVVNYAAFLEAVLAGFKARMAELGYVEGQNVTYLYHGVLEPDPQVIEHEVKSLLDQKVDLFLTLGTRPTLTAKKATVGTHIPVVFAPLINPVGEGIVESITRPGGNVTGVQNGDTIPKALEWLHNIVPQTTRVHVIYHPKDTVSLTSIKSLSAIATSLGVELVLDEVHSPQEAIGAIEALPRDAALFFVPTARLEPLSTLIEVAAKRGIAVGANNHREGALITYAGSFPAMGQQAARLADQILKGTKPADLPVETAEYFLHINLRTATAIGLDIPDAILHQADMVMR
jgi:putative tryptophan/tyrosine transport system substrate-binding protein